MDPAEIRRIRGSLSRAAFARLLNVSPLSILRWELPEDSKEARRPRAKMIEALRRLDAEGVGRAAGSGTEADEDDEASEPPAREAPPSEAPNAEDALLEPLLERLNREGWQQAEDELLRLLSSGTLTPMGRHLATMGLVQVQVLARLDTRGALASLLPILDEANRGALPASLAGRAHALAAMIFSQPDSRLFDPGRINAHAARAEELLGPHAGDLHVLVVVSRLAATRFLGADVTLHVYQTYGHYLQRASTALATMLADGVHASSVRAPNSSSVEPSSSCRPRSRLGASRRWRKNWSPPPRGSAFQGSIRKRCCASFRSC